MKKVVSTAALAAAFMAASVSANAQLSNVAAPPTQRRPHLRFALR
jgi:hypothetical protein